MSPATHVRDVPGDDRMLVVDPEGPRLRDARVRDLPAMLRRGDLLVVNDAATLPASIAGTTASGEAIEIRLAAAPEADRATAVLFGAGDWRTRTEDRPPPPLLAARDRVDLGGGLAAIVEGVSATSPRLVEVRLEPGGDALWPLLYARGRPVQYAYLRGPLSLFDVQTSFASRPWAVELPSAGRPLAWETLGSLRQRGVTIASITHGAGLSSTGDPRIDALLPLPERFAIPAGTARAIVATRAAGGRIVAVGTTVVRALEGSAAQHGGATVAGAGVTDLHLGAGHRLRVVDGLLTGIHEPSESHFRLLEAFAPRGVLEAAHALEERLGYLSHELGDSSLILPERAREAVW